MPRPGYTGHAAVMHEMFAMLMRICGMFPRHLAGMPDLPHWPLILELHEHEEFSSSATDVQLSEYSDHTATTPTVTISTDSHFSDHTDSDTFVLYSDSEYEW